MTTKALRLDALGLFASLVLIAGGILAAEPPAGAPATPSRETREKMAAMHEQMAACLRSDKPIAECRQEAMKHHQEMMGKDGCPMMDMHQVPKASGKTDAAPQK
jgi:hypothetical protein